MGLRWALFRNKVVLHSLLSLRLRFCLRFQSHFIVFWVRHKILDQSIFQPRVEPNLTFFYFSLFIEIQTNSFNKFSADLAITLMVIV